MALSNGFPLLLLCLFLACSVSSLAMPTERNNNDIRASQEINGTKGKASGGKGDRGFGGGDEDRQKELRCPDGWISIKKSHACYRLLLQKTGFDEGRSMCHKDGAELASVHSQEEMSIIDDFTLERMWLGLQRDGDNNFQWTDGSRVDYSDWYPGEPSSSQNNERCAWRVKDEPGWNDVPCESLARPLCKRRLTAEEECQEEANEIPFECVKTAAPPLSSFRTGSIIAVVVASLLLVLIIIISFYCIRRRCQMASSRTRQLQPLNKQLKTNDDSKKDLQLEENFSRIDSIRLAKFDRRFLIPPSHIGRVEKILGKGNFGVVYRTEYYPEGKKEPVEVACKQLYSIDDLDAQTEFLQEASIMMSLRHTHVVGNYGVSFNEDKIAILVMELMEGGCLQRHLQCNHTTDGEKLRFGTEIASGMLYLHSCKLIHRDLATRNCMLTSTLTLKLCDFGLARELRETYEMQHDRPMPYRWTAPEAYYQHCVTTKSDVWSYGVTLWEIYSRGAMPFPETNSVDAHFQRLRESYRPAKPSECSDEIYRNVIWSCWMFRPEDRPGFGDLFVEMTKCYQRSLLEENVAADKRVTTGEREPAACLSVKRHVSMMNEYELPDTKLQRSVLKTQLTNEPAKRTSNEAPEEEMKGGSRRTTTEILDRHC